MHVGTKKESGTLPMVDTKNNENDTKKEKKALLEMAITKAKKGFRRTKTHTNGMIDV
jgi:hypothetical protein